MFPIRIEAPAVEPVGLAEMRAYLRLADDDGAEDDFVATLVTAAREAVEAACGRVLIESRWRVRLEGPAPPRAVLALLSPLIAVDGVVLRGADGAATVVAPERYRIAAATDPPRVVVDLGAASPGAGAAIEVEFRAGYGAAGEAVPGPLRQALRSLVAHWFENRGDGSSAPLPPDVAGLIAPYRRPRL